MGTVITFLRLAGLTTAAVWLGGTVFFMLAMDPLLGSSEWIRLLGPLHAGEVSVQGIERFHLFMVLGAGLALVHLLAEWLYSGRNLDVRLLALLLVLLALGSTGRLYLAPKCRQANLKAYLGPDRQVQRQALSAGQKQAEQSLAVWHGVLVVVHVIALSGVVLYFLYQASPQQGGPRLFPRARLKI